MRKILYIILATSLLAGCKQEQEQELVTEPADYVSILVGTLSEHSFSTGNTYPAIAMPWGMNFWTPVTGKMGDGWAYRYDAHPWRCRYIIQLCDSCLLFSCLKLLSH